MASSFILAVMFLYLFPAMVVSIMLPIPWSVNGPFCMINYIATIILAFVFTMNIARIQNEKPVQLFQTETRRAWIRLVLFVIPSLVLLVVLEHFDVSLPVRIAGVGYFVITSWVVGGLALAAHLRMRRNRRLVAS